MTEGHRDREQKSIIIPTAALSPNITNGRKEGREGRPAAVGRVLLRSKED